MHNAWPFFFVLALGACADACDGSAPSRSVQVLGPSGTEPYEGPPPEGSPVSPNELKSALPETIGQLAPQGPPEPRQVPLSNKGTLTSARRSYAAGGQTLTLEITDTVHAPDVRALVNRAQELAKKTEHTSFEGTKIQGHRAVLQWHGSGKIALANALVGERFLVNLRLQPADDTVLVAALAEQVPLAKLLELKARNEGGEATAEAAAPEARVGEPSEPKQPAPTGDNSPAQ
jgi:hypothetical protein